VKDLINRTVWTFVEAFAGAIIVGGVLDLGLATIEKAALAGGAAALTVVLVYARQQLDKPWASL